MAFSHMVTISVLCGFITVVSGSCNSYYGPSGSYECVRLSGYTSPQYATCLTDTYIQTKSNEKHHCRDRTTSYCWYQCMCELNNECSGPNVYNNCACDPNHPRTTSSPQVTLPPSCYSPDGSACSWYQNCLEKRYPCQGTDAGYAITYAQKFCELYSDHYSSFSSKGQKWINEVRKCLQVELVPILRPWVTKTCTEIKTQAFASHTKCYTTPGVTSFCSLSFQDRLKIFWTIKGAFINAFSSSLNGLWGTMLTCYKLNSESVDLDDNNALSMQVFVKYLVVLKLNPDFYSSKIIDSIAFREHWADKGLAWFGYQDNANATKKRDLSLSEESTFRIDVVLVSKSSFDLNSWKTLKVDIKEIVLSLSTSVKRGMAEIIMNDVSVDVLSMIGCGDLICSKSNFIAVSAPSAGMAIELSGMVIIVLGVLNVLKLM